MIIIPSTKQFSYTQDKKKRIATLQRVEDGNLIYQVTAEVEAMPPIFEEDRIITVEFPIPLEDTKGATFGLEEHSTLLKRFYNQARDNQSVKVVHSEIIQHSN